MQLEEAGLETEEDEDMESKGIDLRLSNVKKTLPCSSISEVILLMVCSRFVKLHVPMEVLKRYAEILKLRMKLKVRTIKLKVSPAQRKMLV